MARVNGADLHRFVVARARQEATTVSAALRAAITTNDGMVVARAISAEIGAGVHLPRLVLSAYERVRANRTTENLESLAQIARDVFANADIKESAS